MTTVLYSKCCEQSASHLDRVVEASSRAIRGWVKCELCGAAGPSIVVVILKYHSSEVTISQFTAALKMSTSLFADETLAACVIVQHNER